MNVTLQVRVPITVVKALDSTVDQLRQTHEKEMARAGKNAKPEKIQALNERSKRLTTLHLMRAVVTQGLDKINTLKPDELLVLLDADKIVRGRPRGTR